MKGARTLSLILLFSLGAFSALAEDRDLLSIVYDLGAVLEWNPLRDVGVIVSGEDRISLGIGIPSAVINYRLLIAIDPPVRRDGAVWLTREAVAAIGEAISRDRLARAAERLRISHILIDPGHGGGDPGAVGKYASGQKTVQVFEKEVVLKIGRELSGRLAAEYPDKKILMTRSDDTYVSLEKRAELANALLEKTRDTILYISIHANSTINTLSKARGFEVWYLPPAFRRTLIDRKGSEEGDRDILPILNSMLEEEISVESIVLARDILAGLDGQLGRVTENRGLRQESWYVVRSAKMPAVLVEVGFMSSREEAARLSEDAYLKNVAEGLYDGVRSFITRFERNGGAGAR
jgi:N-acetylmuramoyl-L-alanine amidase